MLYNAVMNGKEVLKLLKKNGWQLDRVSGSHHILAKGNQTITVPVHGSADLKTGTLKAIFKQAGLKNTGGSK